MTDGGISLYLFSLNCARLVQQPAPLTAAFSSTFPSEAPELLLFSLQELAPLAESFLGGTRITPYTSAFTSAVLPFLHLPVIPHPSRVSNMEVWA